MKDNKDFDLPILGGNVQNNTMNLPGIMQTRLFKC